MNILKKIIFFSFLLTSILSCCKTIPEKQCPPDCPQEDTVKYPLDKVWETYYYDDTTGVLSIGEVIIYKDYILYNCWTVYDGKFHIFVFDKKTGRRMKIFDLGHNTVSLMKIIDKYLIVPSGDDIKIFDLETLTLAKIFTGEYEPDLTVFGNSAYIPIFYGGVPYSDSSAILKVDIPSFETEKVLSITAEEYGSFGALNIVSLEIDNTGDTLLYGTMEVLPKRLYSYNMTQDSFAWITDVRGGDFYMRHPLFDDEYIYITNNRGAEAYDKFTGEMIWRTDLEGEAGYRPIEPLLVGGKLFALEAGYHFYCLNAKDGEILWHNKNAGGGPSNYLTHFDGYIYYGGRNNRLHIIDMETGKVLLSVDSPYDNTDYAFSKEWQKFESMTPAIDTEEGVFYMPDRLRMFCFKLWHE